MKPNPGWLLFAYVIAMLTFVSCDKKSTCEFCSDNNLRPIAKGGSDTIIVLPADSILLDGSSSLDPDGTITNYNWSVVPSSPTGDIPSIRNNNAKQTVVVNLRPGIYQFELKVTDNRGAHSVDTVMVQLEDRVYPKHPVGFYPWLYAGFSWRSVATNAMVIGPVPEWQFSNFPEDNTGSKWKIQLVQQGINATNFLPFVEYNSITTSTQSIFYSISDLVVSSPGENPVGSIYIFADATQTSGIDFTKQVDVIVYIKP